MGLKYPVYVPYFKGKEREYVDDCMDTTWISSKGKYVKLFEDSFAKYININHATSVCNGTVAIHLALLAMGIKPGDEVIVPTFTYVATVNPVLFIGATPVFADSLPDTWQIDPDDIERKITPKTKAVLVVHLYGHPCEMDKIVEICRKHNIYLIEDCAEAMCTKYKNQHAGTFGDIAAFSFFGNKTITTGEGGMVATNNPEIYKRAANIKNQGLSPSEEYWHDVLGYNYRMTNICAAIGLAQLENIDEILKNKIRIADRYRENFENTPVEFHKESEDTNHSYWMCSILFRSAEIKTEARKHLDDLGIETRPLFKLVHKMPMYKLIKTEEFPVIEGISKRGINIPSYPALSNEDVDYISEKILQIANKYD